MNIEIITQEIRQKLKTVYKPDEIAIILEPYRAILEKEVKSNSRNVEAYSLLAILFFELNDVELAFGTLERCYKENVATFSDNEYCLWATNIAYFIDEKSDVYGKDESEEEDKVIALLEEAVRRKSNFSNTYYALGRFYFEKKLFGKAGEMFNIAYSISSDRTYLYYEAMSLLADSKRIEGVRILESLYRYPFIDEGKDADIALMLGRELAFMGETDRATKIAHILLNTDNSLLGYIELGDIVDFLYILEDFKSYIEYYDDSDYAYETTWLDKYFYAMKKLGKKKEASIKLDSIKKEFDERILQLKEMTRNNPLFEDENKLVDHIEYIESEIDDLEDIIECYEEVFFEKMIPPHEDYYDISYKCYYINCPRHSG